MTTLPTVSRSARGAAAAEAAMAMISGRWKGGILFLLASGCCRYVHLIARLPGISPKVLTSQLRALETRGMITRHVVPHGRKRVEYELTPLGEGLRPLLSELARWGRVVQRTEPRSPPAARSRNA